MVSPTTFRPNQDVRVPAVRLADLPLLYEDEGEGDMGESNPHVVTGDILRYGFKAHLTGQTHYRVFSNLNLYYHPVDPAAYLSPDTMIVVPYHPLGEDTSSYRLGVDGPAPVLTAEALSERSAQQRDLRDKVIIYAALGVEEYILVDVTGRYLPQRLLLKRLQPDGTWKDEQDSDGGVTSRLGFRLVIEADGQVRVLDSRTGKRYVRPGEAEQRVAEADRRTSDAEQRVTEADRRTSDAEQRVTEADKRIQDLEAELARLRQMLQERPNS